MSNTIQPYDASRSGLQRAVRSSDQEDDASRENAKRIDLVQSKSTLGKGDPEQVDSQEKVDQRSPSNIEQGTDTKAKFDSTLGGAIDRPEEVGDNKSLGHINPQQLNGLTQDEQQLIHRYFPESPSLELRLYKPDMSTDRVDPGSVGSRVDLRG